MEKEKKTGAILASVAAIALCGVPGLCLLCPFGVAILAGVFNGWQLPYIDPWVGVLPLCLAVIFVIIAIVVPLIALRKKKPSITESLPPEEPLPPTS
ncbi:MAG: hypothetical protein NZL98_01200 [Anaerolineales bacterium]|nr:hypothetical protein [Anaerolineales bacterium]MDW8227001.1 hypothetical protein [Anaerolineales bacterium]